MKFSANLGFLWNDRPLPNAIRAAKAAGFDAVECHWPYDQDVAAVRAALDETGLPMLGLNTDRGDLTVPENGLCALPGRQVDARATIDQALDYAQKFSVKSVHVMAGFAAGQTAEDTFVENLTYAADKAAALGITILIEPLNRHDAPGYFLQTTDQAKCIIERVGAANLKLMFDCYHVGRTEGDVITRLSNLSDVIGHIQFASVPTRGRPDQGELNYRTVFDHIASMDWDTPLGAEYKPIGSTDDSLGWMKVFG